MSPQFTDAFQKLATAVSAWRHGIQAQHEIADTAVKLVEVYEADCVAEIERRAVTPSWHDEPKWLSPVPKTMAGVTLANAACTARLQALRDARAAIFGVAGYAGDYANDYARAIDALIEGTVKEP